MIIDETTFSILNTLRKTSDHALRALCIVVVTSEVGFRFEYHLFLEKKFVSKVPPDIKHIFLLYFSIFQMLFTARVKYRHEMQRFDNKPGKIRIF